MLFRKSLSLWPFSHKNANVDPPVLYDRGILEKYLLGEGRYFYFGGGVISLEEVTLLGGGGVGEVTEFLRKI